MTRSSMVVVCLLFAACGDDESAGTCESQLSKFDDCGGNPVGTWTLEGYCTEPVQTPENDFRQFPACLDAPASIESVKPAGTLTIATDGKFTENLDITTTTRLEFSDDCTAQAVPTPGTGEENCSSFDRADSGATTISCEHGGETCVCAVAKVGNADGQGTFEVEGGQLVRTDAAGVAPRSFCVDGKKMLIRVEETERKILQLYGR